MVLKRFNEFCGHFFSGKCLCDERVAVFENAGFHCKGDGIERVIDLGARALKLVTDFRKAEWRVRFLGLVISAKPGRTLRPLVTNEHSAIAAAILENRYRNKIPDQSRNPKPPVKPA